jgi:DNA processing protein
VDSISVSGINLYYKGDISLLDDISKNIAVIGLLNPSPEIEIREQQTIKQLVKNGCRIVSGLAKGCDTIAHKTCIATGGKTIAILPTPLDNVYPKENKELAQSIVANGGVLITEYNSKPQNKSDAIKRFIERDRLQAYFSNAVVLIASYRKGEGDSGSRYAMQYAKKYSKRRYMLFNAVTDTVDPKFGLNQDLINEKDIRILTNGTIKEVYT